MKFKLIVLAILTMILIPNVKALELEKDYYVNSENVIIPIEQYNAFKTMGYTDAMLEYMPQETYDTYGDLNIVASNSAEKYFRETTINGYKNQQTIVEEITKEEYENEEKINSSGTTRATDVSGSHETTYKKLTVLMYKTSTVYPAKRAVVATLTWKNLPKVRSHDIFAARATNGEIHINSYQGTMTQKTTSFINSACDFGGEVENTVTIPYGSSAWNTQSAGVGNLGIGFTGKLSTEVKSCWADVGILTTQITGYSSTLSFNAAASSSTGSLTVNVSYQHASKTVAFNDVYRAYSFSSSGLGGVVYFSNSTLRNSYDGMGGVSVTL